jgi:hypothetical protein
MFAGLDEVVLHVDHQEGGAAGLDRVEGVQLADAGAHAFARGF